MGGMVLTDRIKTFFAGAILCGIIIAACNVTGVLADDVVPLSPGAMSSPGFTMTDKGIKYLKPDGNFLTDSWLFIGAQAWCFDSDGIMVTGKRIIDGRQWFLTYEGGFLPYDASGKPMALTPPAETQTTAADTGKAAPTTSVGGPSAPSTSTGGPSAPSSSKGGPSAPSTSTGGPSAPSSTVSGQNAAQSVSTVSGQSVSGASVPVAVPAAVSANTSGSPDSMVPPQS